MKTPKRPKEGQCKCIRFPIKPVHEQVRRLEHDSDTLSTSAFVRDLLKPIVKKYCLRVFIRKDFVRDMPSIHLER